MKVRDARILSVITLNQIPVDLSVNGKTNRRTCIKLSTVWRKLIGSYAYERKGSNQNTFSSFHVILVNPHTQYMQLVTAFTHRQFEGKTLVNQGRGRGGGRMSAI